jgi:hypothetical protein
MGPLGDLGSSLGPYQSGDNNCRSWRWCITTYDVSTTTAASNQWVALCGVVGSIGRTGRTDLPSHLEGVPKPVAQRPHIGMLARIAA